ncbi:MAG: replicative DNA helicase, partial [Prochlorothrix sp.]
MLQEEQSFQPLPDRIPPQIVEAEEAILGSILLDPEAISRISERLKPEAFYISAHREIYYTALRLYNQSKPTDLTTVAAYLQDEGKLDKVGGQSRLAQLVDRTISTANVDQYAELVIDKAVRRQLIKAGNEIIQLGYDTRQPLEKVLDKAEQQIFNLAQNRPQSRGLTPTASILAATFNEIEQRSTGMEAAGISCNFYDLDAMTQGFQRSDLIIVAGRPSMGKCLAYDSEIVLSDGSVRTIAEIYQSQQQLGQSVPRVLTLGQDWRLGLTQPSVFVDDGIKPVFRVVTRLGRSIETTLTHPFLTMEGWKPLEALQAGVKVAVPRRIPIFGCRSLPEAQVKVLAYLIGDGCLTGTSPQFTNCNDRLQADFAEAVGYFPGLTAWLDDLGLWGKDSHAKFVPSPIFQLEASQIALFLNRLFATDGWITVLNSGQVQLGYASVSEKLVRQLQHLLLRFGIIASLKARQVKYQGTRRPAWQLDITDGRSIQTFIEKIGIFGKEKAVAQAQEALATKRYQTNRDLIPVEVWAQLAAAKGSESWKALAERSGIQGSSNLHVGQRAVSRDRLAVLSRSLQNPELENLATSDVYWDEITAIELMGYKQVYDLTIPETHNFVANDICVHNTSFVLSVAQNIAAIHKKSICIFSLEMSKEQLVYRLLSSEVGIESGRLRAGRVRDDEWATLCQGMNNLSELPIYIDDTPDLTVGDMRSKARQLALEHNTELGLVLIDYLQLMEGASPDNRVQELSRITRALKGMARELNVPVITLSQLSRGVESRTNKRPMMSDLRESGSIEQDADLIIMLYRDEYYNPDTPDRGITEVIITKHRNGPIGTVKLLFEPQYTRFRNLAN